MLIMLSEPYSFPSRIAVVHSLFALIKLSFFFVGLGAPIAIIILVVLRMNKLLKIFILKIVATILWCLVLIFFSPSVLVWLGLPYQGTYMFIRLLGFAYLSLCLGYFLGLQSIRKCKPAISSTWVGILSNGLACIFLFINGITGVWSAWGSFLKIFLWSSTTLTFFITVGLIRYGIFDNAKAGKPS